MRLSLKANTMECLFDFRKGFDYSWDSLKQDVPLLQLKCKSLRSVLEYACFIKSRNFWKTEGKMKRLVCFL